MDGLVLKAQVLAGGRGKGHFDNGFQGGVQMVDGLVYVPFRLSAYISASLRTGRDASKAFI